jgi:hypothetical protein
MDICIGSKRHTHTHTHIIYTLYACAMHCIPAVAGIYSYMAHKTNTPACVCIYEQMMIDSSWHTCTYV